MFDDIDDLMERLICQIIYDAHFPTFNGQNLARKSAKQIITQIRRKKKC